AVPAGHYVLTAKATDNQGGVSTSAPVDIFVNTSGGTLTGSVAASPTSVDLSTAGTLDWTHWGLATNSLFDRKSGVPQRISNFTKLGTNTVQRYADNHTAFSWNDGTPTPAA